MLPHLGISEIGLQLGERSIQSASEAAASGHGVALTFLWIAVILIAAKLSGVVERIGQPSVLGELVIGVVIGNLALLGISIFEPIKSDSIIAFLAELGVVILLFQIGLESDLHEMRRVGYRAFLVAVIGMVVPFVLGTYLVGPWLLPGLSSNAYLFLGATLTATSVGITAKVFYDLGKLRTPEAQIVLGAAVIDDILGLLVLAIVSAIVTVGAVDVGTIGWIMAKAFLFLIGAVVVGQLLVPRLGKSLSKLHAGVSMKFTLAISIGLLFAYLAETIGLAPIVGAFAAGVILDPSHFSHFKNPKIVDDLREGIKNIEPGVKESVSEMMEPHVRRHIHEIVEPLGYFLAPIFFVYTGMAFKLETLSNLPLLLVALVITIAAILGKAASGLAAGNVSKKIVGLGMVPRGEVGLIFAAIGRSLGVFSDEVFSVIVIVVIVTTFITPSILSTLLKQQDSLEPEPASR